MRPPKSWRTQVAACSASRPANSISTPTLRVLPSVLSVRGGCSSSTSSLLSNRGACLSESALSGGAQGLVSRPDQRPRLVAAFLILALRVAVGDHASARLHMQHTILYEGGAQADAGVHVAVRTEIADGACVGTAAVRLQFLDDLHGPHLRCPGDGSGRETRDKGVDGIIPRVQATVDIGRNVHHVAIAFDDKLFRHPHAADLGNT